MRFGDSSISWPISNADFLLMQVSRSTCVGGFFSLDTSGTSAPPWIVGDTFLKNVYAAFQYDPPAVGFAKLSPTALAMNGAVAPAPSATIGSVQAAVSATGTLDPAKNRESNAARRVVGGGVGVGLASAAAAALLAGFLL